MSVRRRRSRTIDPLATPAAVRDVLRTVRESVADTISLSDNDLVRILRAASHCERRGWTPGDRGRPARYDRKILLNAWLALARVLERGTRSTVSPRTFTEQYLRLLACPAEVVQALTSGRINIFEALQLSRIKARTTGLSSSGASKLRSRVLASHIAGRGSARQLYERVNELLGRARRPVADHVAGAASPSSLDDEIDGETDAYLADPGSLFSDQIRAIASELARIDATEITEAETTVLLDLLDQLYLRSSRIARRIRS